MKGVYDGLASVGAFSSFPSRPYHIIPAYAESLGFASRSPTYTADS
jgi:hypothetical protein